MEKGRQDVDTRDTQTANRIRQIAEETGKDLAEKGMHRGARLASIALTEHYLRSGAPDLQAMAAPARDAFLKGLQEMLGAKMVEDHLKKDPVTGKMEMTGVPVGMIFCAMEQMCVRLDTLESRLVREESMRKIRDKKIELLEKRVLVVESRAIATEASLRDRAGALEERLNTTNRMVNELMDMMKVMSETVKTLSALAKKNESVD